MFKKASIKTYFVAGLLVIVPLVVTVWLAQSIVLWIDSFFPLEKILGIYVPGLGLIIALFIILFAGVVGRNFLGAWLVDQLSLLVSKIPLLGSVYGSVRQVLMTLSTSGGERFGRAVLVQYPQEGSWAIGFTTVNRPPVEVGKILSEDVVSVFIPTTPNPTSGFFIFVQPSQVKPLNVSVEEAFKMLVSLGMVSAQRKKV